MQRKERSTAEQVALELGNVATNRIDREDMDHVQVYQRLRLDFAKYDMWYVLGRLEQMNVQRAYRKTLSKSDGGTYTIPIIFTTNVINFD